MPYIAPHRPVGPTSPCNWNNLPAELKHRVLDFVDHQTCIAVACTNRHHLELVAQTPEAPWRQRQLMAATKGQTGDALVSALRDHRAALRARTKPFWLPSNSPLDVLTAVSTLVAGSRQRPVVKFSRRDVYASIEFIPPHIAAIVDLNNSYIGAAIGSVVMPRGVHTVFLECAGLDPSNIGKLNLPDGVVMVYLGFNTIGAAIAHLRVPLSTREVYLGGSSVNEEYLLPMRQRYPSVNFDRRYTYPPNGSPHQADPLERF